MNRKEYLEKKLSMKHVKQVRAGDKRRRFFVLLNLLFLDRTAVLVETLEIDIAKTSETLKTSTGSNSFSYSFQFLFAFFVLALTITHVQTSLETLLAFSRF
jgi:hypothetical protein